MCIESNKKVSIKRIEAFKLFRVHDGGRFRSLNVYTLNIYKEEIIYLAVMTASSIMDRGFHAFKTAKLAKAYRNRYYVETSKIKRVVLYDVTREGPTTYIAKRMKICKTLTKERKK